MGTLAKGFGRGTWIAWRSPVRRSAVTGSSGTVALANDVASAFDYDISRADLARLLRG